MHGYLSNADTWLRSCFEISTFFADFPADSRQAPRNTHRLTGHYGTITASLAAASAPCARPAFSATAANQPSSATSHFSRHGSEERLLALSSSVPVMAPRKRRAPAPATADDRSITVALWNNSWPAKRSRSRRRRRRRPQPLHAANTWTAPLSTTLSYAPTRRMSSQ
jgi:hypothetical protein